MALARGACLMVNLTLKALLCYLTKIARYHFFVIVSCGNLLIIRVIIKTRFLFYG